MSLRAPVSFRDKAETCRSLARYVTDEGALRVLREIIAANTAKVEELQKLSHQQDVSPLLPTG
jgi:hypothetical protein